MKLDFINLPAVKASDAHGVMPKEFEPGLVSVIIPTFNRGNLLGEAIDSVLGQTYRPIECVIADANSTDNTFEVVRRKQASITQNEGFKLIYVTEPNRGASASRNLGLRNCSGEFIQFLDSDDVLTCEKLNHQVQVLRSDGDLEVVWSGWTVVLAPALQTALQKANVCLQTSNFEPAKAVPTKSVIPWEPWPCLFRRRLCIVAGPWNEKTSRLEDWEYALRILSRHPKAAFLEGVYCVARIHEGPRQNDLDFKPDGVERGLVACREARKANLELAPTDVKIRQLIGERYWEIGLEALLRGTDAQAIEAFGAAAGLGSRKRFRMKAVVAWCVMRLTGRQLTKRLLKRHLTFKQSTPQAMALSNIQNSM
jgi:glycosyltransferase involved in cell wall biosynthesis